ncbi:MAG: hypothetical protein ACI97A_001224 [Planctomycetota bacterium]|jgi:hypothetical protein
MTDLPQSTLQWPREWRQCFRRGTKAEMLKGATFQEAIEVAEASCRHEFAIQVLATLTRKRNSTSR